MARSRFGGSLARPQQQAPMVDQARRDELAKTQLAMHLPASWLRGGEDFIRNLIGRAEHAETRGAKPTDIFHDTARQVQDPANETGLFRSPENTWQFELSDANARINKAFQADVLPSKDPSSGGILGWDQGVTLKDFYQHPELLNRIPHLGGIPIQLDQEPWLPHDAVKRGSAAFYDPDRNNPLGRISLEGRTHLNDLNAPDTGSYLDLMTHETQHAVQNQTGMPRGGMPGDDTAVFGRPELQSAGRAINERFSGEMQRFAQKYESDGLGDYNEGLQVWSEMNPNADLMRSTGFEQGGRAGQFQPFRREIAPSWSSHQDYEALVGETQARQAAQRKYMDVGQRLEKPPFLPSRRANQIPQANQLIRTGGNYFSMPDQATIERLLREQRYGP